MLALSFFHDVGAVRLHRLDADAEVVGDLLVEPAGDDAFEHLRFAKGKKFMPMGMMCLCTVIALAAMHLVK